MLLPRTEPAVPEPAAEPLVAEPSSVPEPAGEPSAAAPDPASESEVIVLSKFKASFRFILNLIVFDQKMETFSCYRIQG